MIRHAAPLSGATNVARNRKTLHMGNARVTNTWRLSPVPDKKAFGNAVFYENSPPRVGLAMEVNVHRTMRSGASLLKHKVLDNGR